jgi:hypothetical protein
VTLARTEPSLAATPFASPVPGRVAGRSEALAPLSRDHQHTLALALELKRAGGETAGEACKRLLDFWPAEGGRHFAEEESVLLPAYARVGDPAHPAVVRTLLEHLLIRAKIGAIQGQGEPRVADLNLLGGWLELHVRHEERVLFRLIEETLPAGELRALAEELGASSVPSTP